jgi:ABC-2 type transport system permease protein
MRDAIEWLAGIHAIAARELLSLFVTPLAYVVGMLFLLQQGYDFALLLTVLNDPLAAPGPVMQYYFGGSIFIFWLPVVAICAALSMRLVAEERRQGTLEAMLTAPIGPGQLVLGKFAGALVFYVALWLPTAVFYVLLQGAGVTPDPGPVASGYLGALLVGASFLALGLVASALSRSQLGAAIATFVTCTILLLLGLLAPEVDDPELARTLEATSLLAMMQELAQGIVDGRWLWLHGSVVAIALWLAALVVDPRRDRQSIARWVLGAIAIAHLGVWGARHAERADWTGGRVYSLSDRAREVLAELPRPVDVRVMVPATIGGGRPNPLHGELSEVLRRMAEVAPDLRVTFVDPDRDRQQAEQLLSQFALSGRDLADGVVLLRAGAGTDERRAHLVPDELVVYATGAEVQVTGPRVAEFRGEEALLGAMLEVAAPKSTRVCVTQGHGEPALDSLEPFGGYAHLKDLLVAANLDVEIADMSSADGIAGCDLLLVAGPSGALPAAHVAAVERHVEAGGELLVLGGAVVLAGKDGLSDHGLEPLLARAGIAYGDRVVLDPHEMAGGTYLLAFTLVEGWGDHPAVRSLLGQRVSVQLVRELDLREGESGPAVALLSSSDDSWAESDVAALARGGLPERGDGDRPGPIPIAAASELGSARIVVVASDEFVLNAHLRDDVVYDHGRDLVLNAIGWLTDRRELLGIRARAREHVKLVLLPEQLRRMALVCLVGLPGFAIALGLWVVWRRRR